MILFTDKTIPLVNTDILIDYFLTSSNSDLAKKVIDNKVYLIQPVLIETLNFLKNKASIQLSLEVAKIILENREIFNFLPYLPDQVPESLAIIDRYLSAKLAFTDCLLLAHAEYYNMKILTQDQNVQACPYVRVVNPFE